jgi:NADPH-dependent 2,4-dienoyl-CoA reductase/sulfur reductase-like enzyme
VRHGLGMGFDHGASITGVVAGVDPGEPVTFLGLVEDEAAYSGLRKEVVYSIDQPVYTSDQCALQAVSGRDREMRARDQEIQDVAVVGGGPVGALLANLLGRDGLRTVVLEREREVHRRPRAVHFDSEVMRIFQSAGLAADLLPDTAPIEG